MEIEIPDSYSPEWQSAMLEQLAGNIEVLKENEAIGDNELLNDCEQIVEALREYSGY